MAQQGRVTPTEEILGHKMTPKQAKFVKEYVKNGGNGTQAALKAYDTNSPKVARSIASENLTKLGTPMSKLLDKYGLTEEAMARQIMQGAIEAEKHMIKGDKVYKVADHYVRHKYIDTAAKLRNLYPSDKLELTGKDGGPLQAEILAGVGFLNDKDTDTEDTGDDGASIRSIIPGPDEV